ncbi:TetR family transcriptional regulator [Falsiroseomonas oryzae]|uniref:TetR family transcriptional regulator n=1 Tax=Falsiroseomonas oryzae TaxID=2766473 RepID=UPI0022EAEF24|nr:TetR family transcriptional regulator [Roseomonas sp. MO-31]
MDTAANPDAPLIEALFRVIADHGWRGVTVTRLSVASGLPARELVDRFPSRLDLLRTFADLVMDEVARGTVPGQGGTPRDRLFDVLMRGLDALAPFKPGLKRLMTEMYTDAVLFGRMAPLFQRSMERMLDAAEIDSGGLKGRLRATGLTLVWIRVVNAWSKDSSEELGPTMAALDRALERAEQAARSFGLADGDLAPPPEDATPA